MKKRALDIEKVEQALKRAAREAVTGPREARAGRFLPSRSQKAGPEKHRPRTPRRQAT